MFITMHNYNLKGVGPGEATLFFLLNKAHLGGGSSAGVDLVDNGEGYEIKAITLSNGIASNFKLGGTVPLANLMQKMYELNSELKLGGSRTEISKGKTELMKQKAPLEFKRLQEEYATIAYEEYFKKHKTIFINNTNANLGKIEAIKMVKKEDIMIERMTGGTIKPMVKL